MIPVHIVLRCARCREDMITVQSAPEGWAGEFRFRRCMVCYGPRSRGHGKRRVAVSAGFTDVLHRAGWEPNADPSKPDVSRWVYELVITWVDLRNAWAEAGGVVGRDAPIIVTVRDPVKS